ncbi:MAG: CapA family protein, partial [Lachnospiraceae bacterium]|nr:CapA family protein [Lachnospiraceae bacterium]
VHHSIDVWKNHKDEILMVGMHESEEAEKDIPTITVNGIKFAVLNYTYGLNGYELPYGEEYLITIMDDSSEDFIADQVKRASETADFVIVCPHWGEENMVGAPNDFQKHWAQLFTEAGADLILGTHPHVIQNIEWITSENGNKALCYYSLGNFVSNQQYTDTVLGGMAYVEIKKEDGQTVIDNNSVIPVVTHNDKTKDPVVIQTYYLADYTQELADVHDTLLSGFNDDFSLTNLQQKARNVFGNQIRDRIR